MADGSVIPTPLGVNPLLTISAVAERSMALLAQDRGWQIDYRLPSAPKAAAAVKAGVEFTETMKGYFSTQAKTPTPPLQLDPIYQRGYDQGQTDNSPFQFTLTIASEDLDDMISNPAHEARMVGTVLAPAISPQPLTVAEGRFNLFTVDANNVDTHNMRYRMKMVSEDGHTYYFEGFKVTHPDSVFQGLARNLHPLHHDLRRRECGQPDFGQGNSPHRSGGLRAPTDHHESDQCRQPRRARCSREPGLRGSFSVRCSTPMRTCLSVPACSMPMPRPAKSVRCGWARRKSRSSRLRTAWGFA